MVASVSFILTGCWFSDWEEWVRVEIKMEVVVTMVVAIDEGWNGMIGSRMLRRW